MRARPVPSGNTEVALTRQPIAALVAALAIVVLPACAHAATFCAHGAGGCAPGASFATIQPALDAAAATPERDLVLVGHRQDRPEGFTIEAGNDVEVAGAGGRPIVVVDAAAPVVVREPGAVVRDLTFWTAAGADPGIDLQSGTLTNADVMAFDSITAVRLGAGTLRYARVNGTRALAVAIRAVGPGGLLEGVEAGGRVGLESTADGLAVRRAELLGIGGGADTRGARVTAGATTIDSASISLVDAGPGAVAADVAAGPGAAASLALRGVTVAGDGRGNLAGARARCTGGAADVRLTDVALGWSSFDLQRDGPGCAVRLDHVRYLTRDGDGIEDAGGVSAGPLGPGVWLSGTTFAPALTSPMVEAGTTAPAAPGELDQLGRPRVVDADASGTATRDLGALEYQRRPPIASLVGPHTMTTSDTEFFSAAGTLDPDLSDQLDYAWAIDGTPVKQDFGSNPFLEAEIRRPGTHTIRVTATDPTGQSSSAEHIVEVTGPDRSAPPQPPFTTNTTPPAPDDPNRTHPPGAGVPPRGVAISAVATRLRKDGLRFGVRCLQPSTCRGVLRAITSFAPRRTTVLGERAFRIKAGRSATVRIPVAKALRRRLVRARRIDVSVIAWRGAVAAGPRWAETVFRLRA